MHILYQEHFVDNPRVKGYCAFCDKPVYRSPWSRCLWCNEPACYGCANRTEGGYIYLCNARKCKDLDAKAALWMNKESGTYDSLRVQDSDGSCGNGSVDSPASPG